MKDFKKLAVCIWQEKKRPTVGEKRCILVIRARSIYQETSLQCLLSWLLPLWFVPGFWAFGGGSFRDLGGSK
ncbi:unnamed protein product [Cunninghamella blakesleeana]